MTSDIRFKALESQRKGHLFLSLATGHSLASPPQEAQEKNKRLTGIRWPLQASPPWQVMTGRSVFWPPDWRGSWRRKNLNCAKILYPELLFARVPLETRWFAWETDMWSEECSRREGTVFGDIFLRKFRLRPKKIVFGDNFTQILPAVTTKHLPDRRTPAAFYFQQDYFFFEYLQVSNRCLDLCALEVLCMIACQRDMLLSPHVCEPREPSTPKHTLPV